MISPKSYKSAQKKKPHFIKIVLCSLVVETIFTACRFQPDSSEVKQTKTSMAALGASEYQVSGKDFVTLDPSWASKNVDPQARKRKAESLAALRTVAQGYFLEQYIGDKEEDDPNVGYGGFNADFRYTRADNPNVTPDDKDPLKYWFKFTFVVGGYDSLLGQIKGDSWQKTISGVLANQFAYAVPLMDNITMAKVQPGKEWFRDDNWAFWSPKNNPSKAPTYNIIVDIEKLSKQPDSFIPIDQLIVTGSDGSQKIPMAVHFGWDGESQGADIPKGGVRYDVELSRKLFYKLIHQYKFTPPVTQFENYDPFNIATPPFKKTIQVRGKPVVIELTVYTAGQKKPMTNDNSNHQKPFKMIPGPDPETAEGATIARQQMEKSLGEKKIVLYLGHSGMGMGFNFGDWFVPEVGDSGTFFAKDLAKVKMMDSYQLVIADGCQTYYLAENFLENQTKRDPKNPSRLRNLNLITSLGFTDADSTRTVTQLLKLLTREDLLKTGAPLVSELLTRYNPDGVPLTSYLNIKKKKPKKEEDDDPLFPVYGMHGTENNPRRNPLADMCSYGRSCRVGSDCGPGNGNICLQLPQSETFGRSPIDKKIQPQRAFGSCTFSCTTDAGCLGLPGGNHVCLKNKKESKARGICVPASRADEVANNPWL